MSVTPLYRPTPRASVRERVPSAPVLPLPRTSPRPLPHDVSVGAAERPPRTPGQTRRAAARPLIDAIGVGTFRASLFSVAMLVTYGVGALLGGVSVEGARRQEIGARLRAGEAAKQTSLIRDKVAALTGRQSIALWAASHGMIDTRALSDRTGLGTPSPIAHRNRPTEDTDELLARR